MERDVKTNCVTACSPSWARLIACGVTRDGLSLSPVLLQGFLSPSPSGPARDWVCNAVLGVAAEGDGDGKASAPLHLLHPVQVL